MDEDRRLGALSMVRCLSEKSSNPDTIEAMFASVKAVIGGSEGRLQSPHQRIGMLTAVQELATAPEGKYIGSLSRTVCSFLIACYKDEGNEDVKLSILSALASWVSRSSDAVQPNFVSFIAAGLKEKEALRRGHLRCLRIICRNPDTISQISDLLSPLIQLVKTGFTKAVQRLDGMYALLIVSKIAACDIKAEDTMVKEKLWTLISQHEPSLVQINMRLQKCLKTCGLDVATFLSTNGQSVCKRLLGPMGLMSPRTSEQQAAVYALSTMMSLAPEDTFTVFKMHMQELPDRLSHDMLSMTDIKIFQTPEGMLSSEQGVYVAETIGAKHTKPETISNQSLKKGLASRDAANSGRRDNTKLTKKADKGKTPKEEARELMLKEEASIREKVHMIQKNLSLVLHALGEMGLANPVFCHSQLPSLVLYHVLGVVPAYQASIGPALNELCLGLQADDVANALYGVYSKDVHVRMACLNAVKCIPAVSKYSLPQNVDIATNIWIAVHDPEKSVAETADDIWARYGYDLGTDYSGIFKALSHINLNVRLAAAEALAAALHESPTSIQLSLSTLFSLYIRDATTSGEDVIHAGWIGRQGIALALQSAADVLTTKDLPAVMTFLISRALADPNPDVRGRMINAGIMIIDKHGKENVSLLFPIFENYLNKKASDEEAYDLVREGVVIFTGALAKHLAKDDPKVLTVVEKLLEVLDTPSESVQRAVSTCLSPLVQSKKEDSPALFSRLLDKLMKSDKYGERRGAAFGLAGVVMGFGISSLKQYGLVVTLQEALIDSAGLQAMDEIIPTLLEALEDDEMSNTALDGLKQIISVRTAAVLPHILPKLVHLPLSALNAHAIGALAEVAGAGFNTHLGTILPALLSAMGDENKEVQELAQEAAQRVVLVIDEEGVETLLSELLKGVSDSQASIRRSSSYLIGYFFKSSKLYLVDEAPNMISTLIVMLSDSDSTTVAVSWEALARVIGSVPKEVLPSYIKLVRDAVSTARDKERRKRKGGYVVISGLCLPKSLKPLLPVFLQGLISGSAELREQAALGLGELIEVTSEEALKEFVIPITGPLIRIIGDRFPWQVKSAILATLIILIQRGGMALKPFLPQLQTTFVKCLQDSTRTIRSSAALALGKLSALSTRIDPLVGDLTTSFVAADSGVREAILSAMRGVIKHAGKSIGPAVRIRIFDLIKELMHNDDDQVRIFATSMLGVLSQRVVHLRCFMNIMFVYTKDDVHHHRRCTFTYLKR
ncbi:hypothetical protein F2Q70_00016592 [Brassica cretica]|uniref:Stalled ribosome sensor GCN1-like HEAT repeats region domain-containing protein n=1 Tax=Brassica cretica TaxID=69181 RepID=A0A8S9HWM7_BRACR|nr:hypothetical protein F2Q70_00016592 [Brassica cretica]